MLGIHIPENKWIIAENIVIDIDTKDTAYMAFSLFYKCRIWSGDKVLSNGLKRKGFENVISTEELFELRESKRKVKK